MMPQAPRALIVASLFFTACAATQPAAGNSAAAGLASEVSRGLGKVTTRPGRPAPATVLLFEEQHASRLGQLEIAIMLLRLHERGVHLVGLEGLRQGEHLDGAWYRRAVGPYPDELAVQLAVAGELGAAELLALLLSDFDAQGLEDPSLYAVDLDVTGWPEAGYLLRLAESTLSPAQAAQLAALATAGRGAELTAGLLDADPWVKARWQQMLQAEADVGQVVRRLHEEQAKVAERKLLIEDGLRDELARTLRFFESAERRSQVMAEQHARLAQKAGGTTAMIVGAAHGPGVRAALERAGLAVFTLRPLSFGVEAGQLSAGQFARKRQGRWAGDGPGSLACALRKPPPIINTASARALVWAYDAVAGLARALRDHVDPVAAAASLPNNADAAVVSVKTESSDVVVQMSLANLAGGRSLVWARARARGGVDPRAVNERGREPMLLARLAELRAGQPIFQDGEYPGAVPIGRDVRALFGQSEAQVAAGGFTAPRASAECAD